MQELKLREVFRLEGQMFRVIKHKGRYRLKAVGDPNREEAADESKQEQSWKIESF